MMTPFRLVGEMTPGNVSGPDLVERGMFRSAALPCITTAIAKATATWPRRRRRHRAGDRRQAFPSHSHPRHRAEQSFGVRMMCFREELAHWCFLDNLCTVHHDHARAGLGD